MRLFKRCIKKPLSERVREAMSIRDINGNLPVMPIVNEDGTVEALYGPVTTCCVSDRKFPKDYFV